MTDKTPPVLHGKLSLDTAMGAFLGDTRIKLLEAIALHGSISQAAKTVPLSYKAAWDAIDAMNNLAPEPLVIRTTGGKHKYIVGDCNYLIADSLTAFHQQAALIADLPWPQIEAMRRIGSEAKVRAQMALTQKISESEPSDARDVWAMAGNTAPQSLVDMDLDTFLSNVKRLPVEEA